MSPGDVLRHWEAGACKWGPLCVRTACQGKARAGSTPPVLADLSWCAFRCSSHLQSSLQCFLSGCLRVALLFSVQLRGYSFLRLPFHVLATGYVCVRGQGGYLEPPVLPLALAGPLGWVPSHPCLPTPRALLRPLASTSVLGGQARGQAPGQGAHCRPHLL